MHDVLRMWQTHCSWKQHLWGLSLCLKEELDRALCTCLVCAIILSTLPETLAVCCVPVFQFSRACILWYYLFTPEKQPSVSHGTTSRNWCSVAARTLLCTCWSGSLSSLREHVHVLVPESRWAALSHLHPHHCFSGQTEVHSGCLRQAFIPCMVFPVALNAPGLKKDPGCYSCC